MRKVLGFVLCAVVIFGFISGCAVSGNRRADSQTQRKVLSLPASQTTAFQPFGTVTLPVDFAIQGAGKNVDTIAFWEASAVTDSMMFVTSKSAELVEVWRFPYDSPESEQPSLTHACISNGTNGVVVDQETDLLYVSVIETSKVCVFRLPDLTYVREITAPSRLGSEPNLALLKLETGETRLYVSDDSIVYIFDAASGESLGHFVPVSGLETMIGDNHDRMLYIPDENDRTGIYAYDANGYQIIRGDRLKLGDNSIFDSDAEGIMIYSCPADGRGFIVVSDQIDNARRGNDYEFFDRQTWQYLGTMKLTLADGSYVYNTDGIASTQQDSDRYGGGLFVAINDDKATVGLSWQKIIAATGLDCSDLPMLTPTIDPPA